MQLFSTQSTKRAISLARGTPFIAKCAAKGADDLVYPFALGFAIRIVWTRHRGEHLRLVGDHYEILSPTADALAANGMRSAISQAPRASGFALQQL